MADPVLYYVEESEEAGRIVAVAPVPLREADRLPDWIQMSVTTAEYRMFTDGKEVVTDWFVKLDQKTQLRTLVSKKTGGAPVVENLISAKKIVPMDEPDYVVSVSEGEVWVRRSDRILGRRGIADFWAISKDNILVVLAHHRIDFSMDGDWSMFPEPSEPYDLYTNGWMMRIGRA